MLDYGSACKSWTECGYTDRFDCIDNKCVCANGYKLTNDSGCVKGISDAKYIFLFYHGNDLLLSFFKQMFV